MHAKSSRKVKIGLVIDDSAIMSHRGSGTIVWEERRMEINDKDPRTIISIQFISDPEHAETKQD